MTRFLAVWRCSEICNGSFQSIISLAIPTRFFCSSIYKPNLLSSTPPTCFFGLFFLLYHSILSYPLLPSSDPVLSLHSFSSILSLCWILLPNSCHPLSFPQSLPHQCFMFGVVFIPFIWTACHPSCPHTAFLFTRSSATQPFSSNWRESPAPLSPLQAAARDIPRGHGLCSTLVACKRDHTSRGCPIFWNWSCHLRKYQQSQKNALNWAL